MKAARGKITATKRARERARAASWMMTATKRARATVTRVAGDKKGNGVGDEKGNGVGNEKGDGDQRQQHGIWLP